MNQFDRALAKAEEDVAPQLHVVAASNGAPKKALFPAALRLLPRVKSRQTRPELAVLNWEHREKRLAGKK